jgi:predicted hotdog family 3-hydroxylacyl-ACP dehydratase
MLLTGAEIADFLPHQAPMILIDHIVKADEHTLIGRIESHRAPSHPLRIRGSLPAISAIEMAAQGCAIHGALRNPSTSCDPRPGVLALIKDISWTHPTLDEVEGPLELEVLRLHSDSHKAFYQFKLTANSGHLVVGELAVFFMDKKASL